MITRVYIDNFRCLSNFEARPHRVNLLIGRNGAGKTTVFDVVANVVALVVRGAAVEDVFPGHTLTGWDSRSMQRMEIDVDGNGGMYHYLLEVEHDVERDRVAVYREQVTHNERTLFLYEDGVVRLHNNEGRLGTQFPYRGRQSFLAQLEERSENTRLTWLLDFFRGIWRLKLDPTAIDPESSAESEALHADGSNFASWYRHLSQERTEDLPTLFDRLRETIAGFRSLKTVSTGRGGRKRDLVAVFSHDGDGKSQYEVEFDRLSDGERAIIVLYCLLMAEEGDARTLLLDEPENFVGLSVIQPWLVDLADALRDEGQLFMISHHPEVIDYLAADHALLLERPTGGPTRVRAKPFDRDRGLKASELVARGLVDAG